MSNQPAPLVLSPEPFETPTTVDLPDDVVVVQMTHENVSLGDLAGIFDAGYGVLAGFGPVGPGFASYRGDVSATFDLTIGFPVREQETGQPADLPEGVEHARFPSGSAIVLSHLGPYDGLPAAWEALVAAAEAQVGAESIKDAAVEIYVADPSQTPTEELRTDLVLLLG